ncbi:MAG: sterol desaturase family protein [Gammaproteobacteria bacterium]|nr:sterol desaturase family protein [Gammaproteobacteria bacterium]
MTLLLYFVVLLAFSMTFTLEVIAPASGAECDKRWQIYAGTLSLAQVGATLAAGVIFAEYFRDHALYELPTDWSAPLKGLCAFSAASFIAYWWHRAMHQFDGLWRVFHQLHHSPSRIESLTAFYIHPFDGIAATFINAFSAYVIFGADARAAGWALLYAALNNLYIHMDLKTPHWTGYLLQRPEMHRVHHQRGSHRDNYGLPIWDLLFGTFVNPRNYIEHCGFVPDEERRIKDMLMLRKVTE